MHTRITIVLLQAAALTAFAAPAEQPARPAAAPSVGKDKAAPRLEDTLELPAADAICHGSRIRYEAGDDHGNIGYWWNPNDWIEWKFVAAKPGKFNVSAEIASPGAGSFEMTVGKGKLKAAAPNTGSWNDYATVNLGTIEVAAAGPASLEVRAIAEGWVPFNVRSFSLSHGPAKGADSKPAPAATLKQPPAKEPRVWTAAQLDDAVTLPAADAVFHGRDIRRKDGCVGNWKAPSDWVEWHFLTARPGTFNLSAQIAAEGDTAVEASVGDAKITAKVPAGDATKAVSLGAIEIPAAGRTWLQLRPVKEGWKPLSVKTISLVRDPANNVVPKAAPVGEAARAAPTDRVTHYAVMMTGPCVHRGLVGIYWGVNAGLQEMLSGFGYPDAAVYRLHEQGKRKDPRIDGMSTQANFREVFAHLSRILKKDDHLAVFLVGHGMQAGAESVFVLNHVGGNEPGSGQQDLVAAVPAELDAVLRTMPTQNITIVMNFCHSGGYVPALSRPGRVLCCSNRVDEANGKPWIQAFTEAMHGRSADPAIVAPLQQNRWIQAYTKVIHTSPDSPVSVKEAHSAATDAVLELCGRGRVEHPLLDDNGDGVGHFGTEAVVEGDGALAAKRFLGNEGRPLKFSPAAIAELERLNASLHLE